MSFTRLHPGSEITTQVPWLLIEQAGGVKSVETISIGPNLKIHRRLDGERWRKPVNGRRGFKTATFASAKNGGRMVMCESGGETPMFRLFEIYPPIKTFREQRDIIELADDAGTLWAISDATAEVSHRGDHDVVWFEGKYDKSLGNAARHRLRRIELAFERAGRRYVAIDEGWCRHPIVAEIVGFAFAAKLKFVSSAEKDRVIRLLNRGFSTVRDCAALLSGHECPEELICALMAQRHLEIDLQTRFSPDSVVTKPKRPFWMD